MKLCLIVPMSGGIVLEVWYLRENIFTSLEKILAQRNTPRGRHSLESKSKICMLDIALLQKLGTASTTLLSF